MISILAITPNKKWDGLSSGIMQGLNQLPNVKIYSTCVGNNARNIVSKSHARKLIQEVDFVFVMHGKKPGNYKLLDNVDWTKVVIIDGSEWTFSYYADNGKGNIDKLINTEWAEKAKFYFKRECYPIYQKKYGVLPLQFTAQDSDFGGFSLPKSIDVLCSFGQSGENWPDKGMKSYRQIAIEGCNELKKEGYNVITGKVNNYFKHINRAWITIDAYGGGENNLRTLQIPANKSVLLAKRYAISLYEFEEGLHYYAWDTKDELKQQVRDLLKDKSKLKNTIENSYTNVVKHHTSKARAQYIIDTITRNCE